MNNRRPSTVRSSGNRDSSYRYPDEPSFRSADPEPLEASSANGTDRGTSGSPRAKPTSRLAVVVRSGGFEIAGKLMPCFVLDDARKLIAADAVSGAMGRPNDGRARLVDASSKSGTLPPFLRSRLLEPFVRSPLIESSRPIPYTAPDGSSAVGYEPEFVLQIAKTYLECRDFHQDCDRNIPFRYREAVATSDLVVRALATARTSLTDLVDRATGTVQTRDDQMRHQLWEMCLRDRPNSPHVLFPEEFYTEIFRLRGWRWTPGSSLRPRQISRITEDVIYRRLGSGLPEELRRRNPADRSGRRRHCHHQFFDEKFGLPRLVNHISLVVDLMKASENWLQFENVLNRHCPVGQEVLALNFRASGARSPASENLHAGNSGLDLASPFAHIAIKRSP